MSSVSTAVVGGAKCQLFRLVQPYAAPQLLIDYAFETTACFNEYGDGDGDGGSGSGSGGDSRVNRPHLTYLYRSRPYRNKPERPSGRMNERKTQPGAN